MNAFLAAEPLVLPATVLVVVLGCLWTAWRFRRGVPFVDALAQAVCVATLALCVVVGWSPGPGAGWSPDADVRRCALDPGGVSLGDWADRSSSDLLALGLLVPAGLAAGVLLVRRRPSYAAVTLLAPTFIEFGQWLLPQIGRSCSGDDILVNDVVATAGIACGALAMLAVRRAIGTR